MNILPLTPGLLISMAIRTDHSFFFRSPLLTENAPTLADKQIKLIRQAALDYARISKRLNGGLECMGRDPDIQLIEEMTEHGFYGPDREGIYTMNATMEALSEAYRLATEKGYSGPHPTLTSDGSGVPKGAETLFFD